MGSRLPWLVLLSLLLIVSLPAGAQNLLYEDGPINGEETAWVINFGLIVSNTFTISDGLSTINQISFGAWLFQGDVLKSVDVSITSDEFGGTTYFAQTVTASVGSCFENSLAYNVCVETLNFNGPTLNTGTYWLNMQNAVANTGDPVYWDQNDGVDCHSQGCPSEVSQNSVGTIPPESFSVLGTQPGTTNTTPEPTSLLLMGGGAVAVIGVLRKKLL